MGSAISSQKKGCAAARLRQEELADVEEQEGLLFAPREALALWRQVLSRSAKTPL